MKILALVVFTLIGTLLVEQVRPLAVDSQPLPGQVVAIPNKTLTPLEGSIKEITKNFKEPIVEAKSVSVGGSKEQWMAAAGIPQGQWGYVDSIVSRESGWNPNAINASSGACGLGQQLPCGKWAGAWNDPVAALIAQYQYVNERYGGYGGAVSWWNSHNWY